MRADGPGRTRPTTLGLKARRGELTNFTGIDSPYEEPEHPEVHLRPGDGAPELCVEELLEALSDAMRDRRKK